MDETLAQLVRTRAGFRCEYCLIPEGVYPGRFEYEHIVARQHGGRTVAGNLSYACSHCNRHKGPNLAGIAWQTSRTRLVRLFDPRRHRWPYHFAWEGSHLTGRTAIGRVTVQVLSMNDPLRITLRELLIAEGVFPSDE